MYMKHIEELLKALKEREREREREGEREREESEDLVKSGKLFPPLYFRNNFLLLCKMNLSVVHFNTSDVAV